MGRVDMMIKLLNFIRRKLLSENPSKKNERDNSIKRTYTDNLSNKRYMAVDKIYTIDKELAQLWKSISEAEWSLASERYWQFVRVENITLEEKMEKLDINLVKAMTAEEFYKFLYEDYFVWKYTAKNRLATTRKHLQKYITDGKLYELNSIREQLFSFDLSDIKRGLEIASSIKGLGIAGASGILSIS